MGSAVYWAVKRESQRRIYWRRAEQDSRRPFFSPGAAMSQGFDPYHKWLGIPAHESPPNHYRLLGISLFESDPEVIENALNQRSEHLRSFTTGAHAALAQCLLNEIAWVGACLLRPAEKTAYDVALREAVEAGEKGMIAPPAACLSAHVPAGEQPSPLSESEASGPFDMLDDVVYARSDRGKARAPRRRHVTSTIGILLSGAIGLAGGFFVLFLMSPNHPFIETLVGIFRWSENEAKQGSPSPPKPRVPPRRREPPRVSDRSNLPSDPLPPEMELRPLSPNDSTPKNEPPPQGAHGWGGEAPKRPPPAEIRRKIVVDLSPSLTRVPIPEFSGHAELQIEDVEGIGTPYELTPGNGIVRVGHPVDIVLKDYPGVSIHLSLSAIGEDPVLEVAPKVELCPGRKTPFTKRWLKRALVILNKEVEGKNTQLSTAKARARTIEALLESPPKNSAMFVAGLKQQLSELKNHIIPEFEKQLTQAQSHVDEAQRLSRLLEGAYWTVTITVMIRDAIQ